MPSSSASPSRRIKVDSAESANPNTRKHHICSVCQRAFSTTGHLARHARVHTGERNHKCPFPGCETRCSRQDNLQQHYRIHLSPGSRRRSGRTILRRSQSTPAPSPPPSSLFSINSASFSSSSTSNSTTGSYREESPPLEPPPLEDSRIFYQRRAAAAAVGSAVAPAGLLFTGGLCSREETPPRTPPPPLVDAYPVVAVRRISFDGYDTEGDTGSAHASPVSYRPWTASSPSITSSDSDGERQPSTSGSASPNGAQTALAVPVPYPPSNHHQLLPPLDTAHLTACAQEEWSPVVSASTTGSVYASPVAPATASAYVSAAGSSSNYVLPDVPSSAPVYYGQAYGSLGRYSPSTPLRTTISAYPHFRGAYAAPVSPPLSSNIPDEVSATHANPAHSHSQQVSPHHGQAHANAHDHAGAHALRPASRSTVGSPSVVLVARSLARRSVGSVGELGPQHPRLVTQHAHPHPHPHLHQHQHQQKKQEQVEEYAAREQHSTYAAQAEKTCSQTYSTYQHQEQQHEEQHHTAVPTRQGTPSPPPPSSAHGMNTHSPQTSYTAYAAASPNAHYAYGAHAEHTHGRYAPPEAQAQTQPQVQTHFIYPAHTHAYTHPEPVAYDPPTPAHTQSHSRSTHPHQTPPPIVAAPATEVDVAYAVYDTRRHLQHPAGAPTYACATYAARSPSPIQYSHATYHAEGVYYEYVSAPVDAHPIAAPASAPIPAGPPYLHQPRPQVLAPRPSAVYLSEYAQQQQQQYAIPHEDVYPGWRVAQVS